MKRSVFILICGFSGIIGGCSGEDKESPLSLYQGVWKSPCAIEDTAVGEKYAQKSYGIEGDTVEHSFWFYTDGTCSELNFSGESGRTDPKLIGTIEILNETQSTSVGDAVKVNIVWHATTWIEDGELVTLDASELNSESRFIWLLQVDTLYMGDLGGGSSLSDVERPAVLDLDYPYTRE